jgi:hypothetical protein
MKSSGGANKTPTAENETSPKPQEAPTKSEASRDEQQVE